MKYTAVLDKFDFSWDQLLRGFWFRYPNPKSSHVLAEDTFHREIRNGMLFTKRLIKKRNSITLPKWGEKLCPKYVYVVEESVIDMKSKVITTYTRNLGSTTVCTVHEKCVYKPEVGGGVIALKREVFIKSFLRFVGGAIESIGLRSFQSKTAPNSTLGFNYVLTSMFRPHELLEESKGLLLETKEKSKELILETTKKSKELLTTSKENIKENIKERKEKVYESAHLVAEKSKERVKESTHKIVEKSKTKLESAHIVAEKSRDNLKESKEKIKEKATRVLNTEK